MECKECGQLGLYRKNRTGYCKHCVNRHPEAKRKILPPAPHGICYRCRRDYELGLLDHTKYSMCPACKKYQGDTSAGLMWLNRRVADPMVATAYSRFYGI